MYFTDYCICLPEHMFTHVLMEKMELFKAWKDKVNIVTCKHLYKFIQFVRGDKYLDFGCKLQEKTCEHLSLPKNLTMEFWTVYGKYQVKSSLRIKRQTITQKFKRKFQGAFCLFQIWPAINYSLTLFQKLFCREGFLQIQIRF